MHLHNVSRQPLCLPLPLLHLSWTWRATAPFHAPALSCPVLLQSGSLRGGESWSLRCAGTCRWWRGMPVAAALRWLVYEPLTEGTWGAQPPCHES